MPLIIRTMAKGQTNKNKNGENATSHSRNAGTAAYPTATAATNVTPTFIIVFIEHFIIISNSIALGFR
ncbi:MULTISPECIES: hypothetical protein [Pusillimonas]|uniref:hypothetical protein n=1 Tax=Pusillimonas TaxID=305976 RepID=UPI001F420354|nr:hypothetical protein [Pusillimonas sp. NJUB218]